MINNIDIDKLKKIFVPKGEKFNQIVQSIINWANISGKPTVFPPEAHTHESEDVIGLPKSNFSATTNPTINDDSANGYSSGSLWVNNTSKKSYQCVDPAVGNAVWVELTGSSGGGGGITYSEVASASDLTALTPADGDITLLTGTNIYVIYLDGSWHSLGWLPNVSTGNLYGELIHYSADKIIGKVDGNTVTQWLDLSGNGYNADYYTAAPVYKTNIVNSLPVLRFSDSTKTSMRINYLLGNSTGAQFTLVVVSKQTVSAVRALLSTRSTAGNYGWSFRYASTTGTNYYHTGYAPTIADVITNQFNVLTVRRNGLDIVMGVNGIEESQTTVAGFGENPLDTFTQIGTEGTTTNCFDGDIAEIFIFDSDIGATELGNIVTDLMTKYGIT